MFHRLREPFGKAGLIVAMVALIAAVGGSAIAANTASDSAKRNAKAKKNKKRAKGVNVAQVRRIAKQEARKFANSNPGLPGAPGLQGPAGPAGPKGDKGDNGANGSQGPKGDTGDQGPQGIQGVPGEDGEDGETGFTATLPENKTETGTWSFGQTVTGMAFVEASLSFSIPLEAALPASNVHFIQPNGEEITYTASLEPVEGPPANCSGSVATPEADSGHLCVYGATISEGVIYGSTFIYPPDLTEAYNVTGAAGAGVSGARMHFILEGPTKVGWGSWAVTG